MIFRVGPAGYNLVYELLSLDVWHVAIARPRRAEPQSAGLLASCLLG
jgi:hypothetical protein